MLAVIALVGGVRLLEHGGRLADEKPPEYVPWKEAARVELGWAEAGDP